MCEGNVPDAMQTRRLNRCSSICRAILCQGLSMTQQRIAYLNDAGDSAVCDPAITVRYASRTRFDAQNIPFSVRVHRRRSAVNVN